MSIRSKLAWTFILLLIFGITAISSYSILFIRNYLLQEGEQQIINDTVWLAVTTQNLSAGESFDTNLNEAARTSGYRVAVYDEEGRIFAEVPYFAETEAETRLTRSQISEITAREEPLFIRDNERGKLLAYYSFANENNPARFIRVSIYQDQIYAPIKTIRWIIYTGMFISIVLVLFVSITFSTYISEPILQLESTAREIAEGSTSKSLNLDRNDEFGKLAESLNRMAERLRSDSLEMKRLYQKQNQFFADITHEIRNPLHTIAGSLEMLQLDQLTQEQRIKYTSTALRQTQRISRLFKDLVTLQRFDSDSHFIQKKNFNILPTLKLAAEIHEPDAKGKGIYLKTSSEPLTVYADPDKIEQVIENLVTNAIKFTAHGGVTLTAERQNGLAIVSVKDTGIGITEEHLERLFDRFYRTDKARSRDKGGTGLGLAVVKSILTAHGSDIHVESKPGEGTHFWFELPLA